MKRSGDGGRTWSPLSIAVGDGFSGANTTFRNPYATLVAPTSADDSPTLLLQYVNSTLAGPWVNLQRSSVDAITFGPQSRSQGLDKFEGVLAGPGAGIELGRHSTSSPAPGRLVSCGATGYHAGHAMNAVVWTSDDQGASWQLSPTVFADFQECQVVELSNGTIAINMRNSHLNACDCRGSAVSHDGGRTWGAVSWVTTQIEPVCSAGLINMNGSLFFSNPANKTARIEMTVRRSDDSGATWPASQLLWPGPAAYSVALGLPSEASVAVMYERGVSGPYEEVAFDVVPSSF